MLLENGALAWKIILSYIPVNRDIREVILIRKRREYKNLIKIYFENSASDGDRNEKIYKIIASDVPWTQPDYPLFRLNSLKLWWFAYYIRYNPN